MQCQAAREQIGPYLDGELPPAEAAALREHVAGCTGCAHELERTSLLVAALSSHDPIDSPPPAIWTAIERRLQQRQNQILYLFRRPLALAASLVLLLGGAAFVGVVLNSSSQVAQANTIDYRVLLDGLNNDAEAAVNRFLRHYGAVPMTRGDILAHSPPMHFAMPATLPGGFALQESYRLRFGAHDGYAARYRRDSDEPVFVFFHPPVNKTMMGVHRDSHCSLAQGTHCVEVGPWQLIHFTDPTTCHCLLSRSADEAELRAILAAISPAMTQPSQPS